MANALVTYSKTNFKKEIVVDREHCPNLTKRFDVNVEEVAFMLHILSEQLNSWHNVKQTTTLTGFTYLQILNEFIGQQYSLNV